MMARQGDRCRLDATLVLACLFDIRGCITHLRSGFYQFYDYVIAAGLVANLQECMPAFDRLIAKTQPERMGTEGLKDCWRMSVEMNALVARVCDYKSVEDYMDATSVTHNLHKVKKPLFCLSALDDPFYGSKVIPVDHRFENVLIGTTKRGAHCSFLTGFWIPTESWWGEPAIEYIKFFNRKCREESQIEVQRNLKSSPKKMVKDFSSQLINSN